MKRLLLMWLLLAGIAGVCLTVGCEAPWNDDDDKPAGTSTVQGNVKSFGYQGAAVSAAVKAGITVSLKGTKFTTTTADDGTFIFSAVPAGDYELVIKVGDAEVVYALNVPDNSRVEIKDIVVNANGVISVARITVVDLGSGSSSVVVRNDGGDDSGGVKKGAIQVKVYRAP